MAERVSCGTEAQARSAVLNRAPPRYAARSHAKGERHAARGTGLCRHLRHRRPCPRQGVSRAGDRCTPAEGHRLDAFQPDADRIRADPGHAVRHRGRSDDRPRSRGRGARRFRRRLRARALLPRRHPQHRRNSLGMLPARIPPPRRRRIGCGLRAAADRRLRAGVRLHRQPAARRRRLQPERLPPPGHVRRSPSSPPCAQPA